MKQAYLIFIMSIFLSIGHIAYGATAPNSSMKSVNDNTRHFSLANVDILEFKGNIDVDFVGNTTSEELTISGSADALQDMRVDIDNQRLRLQQNDREKLFAKISVHSVKKISYSGDGSFVAHNLFSPGLEIDISTVHATEPAVVANLQNVRVKGVGEFTFYWVDSPSLTIHGSGNALIHLAGVAGTVNAKLDDFAQLDARYLRARDVYLKTLNSSQADVMVLDALHAYAKDSSSIFYYGEPSFVFPLMQGQGSVLAVKPNVSS